MKIIRSIVLALTMLGAFLLLSTTPASANSCTSINCGRIYVTSASATCADVYDGWTGTSGYPPNTPTGTRKTVCSGGSPSGTDWDAVCKPYGYNVYYTSMDDVDTWHRVTTTSGSATGGLRLYGNCFKIGGLVHIFVKTVKA